jgi:hypothetical protein
LRRNRRGHVPAAWSGVASASAPKRGSDLKPADAATNGTPSRLENTGLCGKRLSSKGTPSACACTRRPCRPTTGPWGGQPPGARLPPDPASSFALVPTLPPQASLRARHAQDCAYKKGLSPGRPPSLARARRSRIARRRPRLRRPNPASLSGRLRHRRACVDCFPQRHA